MGRKTDMTAEEKQLLFKDICARLPYGLKVQYDNQVCKLISMNGDDGSVLLLDEGGFTKPDFDDGLFIPIEKIKPYLRPVSNMTEEEVNRLFQILEINEDNPKEWIKVNDIGIIRLFTEDGKDFYKIAEAIDYLNSIYVNYRDIPDNLISEAPDNMYNN